MKKYLALVLALVMALSLVACGNKTAEEPSGDGDATEAAGRVFWLNFKPEADGTLQKVAAMYTEKTGVPVTIQTAASGTYNETLTAAMDKEAPPTMFVVGNQAAVDTWGDYCYDLTGTGDGQYGLDNLSMIPFYCGVAGEEKAGLNCGTENCWAVNAKASAEDIQATLDFMYWLVTDAEVSRMLVDEFAVMPYKQAAESTCGFLADANAYAAEGNYVMPWVTNFQPNVDAYREAIVAAMNQYDNDPTDANWEQVKTAFVDGWAVQYAAANG